MRQITSKALLYTEMVVAQSLVYSKNRKRFLDFNDQEHPIAIQVGGDDPKILKEVAIMAQDWGYDEINFNVGCPSPKVCLGNFGASLMNSPLKTAKCIESLKNNCTLPVTIKHRIGVDENDSYSNLNNFVRHIKKAGADRFIIHARKAILKGLNPKQNRQIPPLRYDIVNKLKKDNSKFLIEINGGFTNLEQCSSALKTFDGVMIGRSAYKHPLQWKEIDNKIYGEKTINKNASSIILLLVPYIENHLSSGGKSWDICKHLINLVEGIPGAKKWRTNVTNESIKRKLDISDILNMTYQLKENGY